MTPTAEVTITIDITRATATWTDVSIKIFTILDAKIPLRKNPKELLLSRVTGNCYGRTILDAIVANQQSDFPAAFVVYQQIMIVNILIYSLSLGSRVYRYAGFA